MHRVTYLFHLFQCPFLYRHHTVLISRAFVVYFEVHFDVSSFALFAPDYFDFLLIFKFFFTFAHMFILCLGHLPPCLPSPAFRKNLFHPLVLWFCWRENIRDNKKDMSFLLAWNKDIYTERLLTLLPCTCVLQSTMVHLYTDFFTTS
jgi:hypothetical protein